MLDQAGGGRKVVDIVNLVRRLRTKRVHGICQDGFPPGYQYDPGAAFNEGLGYTEAETRAAACNQGRFALERKWVRATLFRHLGVTALEGVQQLYQRQRSLPRRFVSTDG